jgi:hypothetical protein
MTGPGQPYTKLTFVIAPIEICVQYEPKNVMVIAFGE